MGDYLRITRAYVCGMTVAVWCFMLLCLLSFCVAADEFARYQASLLGGVLSAKSYMAMFVYFNACVLGVLLRDNLAQPWATVQPHYRQKHLITTTLIALAFLGLPLLLIASVGASDVAPTGVAVIFLTWLAAGLWTLHHPALAFLVFPFLLFVMLPASFSPLFVALLAGASPVTAAGLIGASLLALAALAWRMLKLDEDGIEYAFARVWGDLLRGRGWQGQTLANQLATAPADHRTSPTNNNVWNRAFTNLPQIDKLGEYRPRTLRERLQLWRLGNGPTRASVSVAGLILIALLVIPFMVLTLPTVGTHNSARELIVLFSAQVMTNPFNTIWLSWFLRRGRLGPESLRPRSRKEWVRELGLALMYDLTLCWLGGLICLGLAASIAAPELLQINNIIRFTISTAVGQLCVYALLSLCLLKLPKQGWGATIAIACCPFVAMSTWIGFVAMNDRIAMQVTMLIAAVLGAAGIATIAIAYRMWCEADLD